MATTDTWTAGLPCPNCGGPTLAPRPDHPEETGDYCETCGTAYDRDRFYGTKHRPDRPVKEA